MTTESTIKLKLLVDNTSKRVIFAEAGKDFVDFLFGLLELPLGSLIRLLAREGMAASWSFGKVYESVKNLDDDYIQPEQTKQILLAPKPSSNTKGTTHIMQKLGYGKPEPSSSSMFGSPSPLLFGGSYSSSRFESSTPSLFGSSSSSPLRSSTSFGLGSSTDDDRKKQMGGYVKGMVTYMISDNLTVKPVSPISSVSLISSLGVKDIGSLEEKNIEIM